jgi:hypothetical protein
MAALAGGSHRCVAHDRRGHGRSGDPGRGHDFDTLADDLRAVMDTLDLPDAMLVGHSMAPRGSRVSSSTRRPRRGCCRPRETRTASTRRSSRRIGRQVCRP